MLAHFFTLADPSLAEISDESVPPIGTVVVVRQKNPELYEVGCFLLDCGCLGVKDAWFNSFSRENFDSFKKDFFEKRGFIERDGPWGRKIIEEGVAYAKRFAIKPHRDYKKAARVFGGINVKDCSEEFVFGSDGKPFLSQGPNDTAEAIQRIRRQLERLCGDDFEFMERVDIDTDEDSYDVREEELVDEVEPLLALIEKGKKKRWAIAQLRALADGSPDSAVASYALGTALVATGDYVGSIKALDHSLELNPEYSFAWYNKGNAHRHLAELIPMIKCYKNAMRFGESSEAYYDSAESALKTLSESVRREDGIDLDTYYEAGLQFEMAWVHIDAGSWEPALVGMRESARMNPRSFQSLGNIGICLLKLGRKDEAREALLQAIEINPDYKIALKNLKVLEKGLDLKKLTVIQQNSSLRS